MLPQSFITYFQAAILAAVSLLLLIHNPLVEASFSPISFLMSKSMSSGGKCCGGASRYPKMMAVEAFDDGTPLSFYRQQVAQIYGGGSGGGGGGGGGYSGGMSSGGHKKPAMQLNQLYKSSFGYQNMLMGGGFMKDHSGFGPAGTHTSKKWRGFGRGLLSKAKSGYGNSNDRLTNVHVVASGATDEYKDSYLTLITNTLKGGGGY